MSGGELFTIAFLGFCLLAVIESIGLGWAKAFKAKWEAQSRKD